MDIQLGCNDTDLAVFLSRPLEADEYVTILERGNKMKKSGRRTHYKWHVAHKYHAINGSTRVVYTEELTDKADVYQPVKEYAEAFWIRRSSFRDKSFGACYPLKDFYHILIKQTLHSTFCVQRKTGRSKNKRIELPEGFKSLKDRGFTYGVGVYRQNRWEEPKRVSNIKFFRVVAAENILSTPEDGNNVRTKYVIL